MGAAVGWVGAAVGEEEGCERRRESERIGGDGKITKGDGDRIVDAVV